MARDELRRLQAAQDEADVDKMAGALSDPVQAPLASRLANRLRKLNDTPTPAPTRTDEGPLPAVRRVATVW